ncbi:MAG: PEP-CTERM sorting domain-containing protein [Bryobacterales bacterium]|nr:PEP-CTERM sorting domain-containing protein [Bryobacterales bacterium]
MSSWLRSLSIGLIALAMTIVAVGAPLELCAGGTFIGAATPGLNITSSDGFACKAKDYVVPAPADTAYGLGTNAGTIGEIDPGQWLKFEFTQPGGVTLEAFDIMVFYNGPEFGDPEEKGSVTVTFADNSVTTFFFTADLDPLNTLTWTGFGTVTNISPMTENNAGWFSFSAFPLGQAKVKSLEFTAISQTEVGNDSDYSVKSLLFTSENVEVPEPTTYALMGLGLLGLAMLRRRRIAA